jgi:hypothetical protein
MFLKARQIWICALLALQSVLPGDLAMAQPSPALAPAIPKVDLTGIGLLSYAFDEATFAPYGPALERSPADIQVDVDAAGKVVACDAAGGTPTDAAKAGQVLCAAIVRTGKVQIPAWYAAGMAGGQIMLRLQADKRVVPQRPIRFVDPSLGKPLLVMEFLGRCMVGRPSMNSEDSDAVCAAFIASGRPHMEGTAAVKSANIGLAVVPGLEPYGVWDAERVGDRGVAVDYGVTLPRFQNRLSATDGRITTTIGPFDYPPRALREEIEGFVKVLIGYDRTGAAQTCRPLQSANSSYLANRSCEVLVKKTRFEFLPDAPVFDGLRYRTVPITWVIPRD